MSGGIGAELSGGNFWEGAVIGGVVAGLNHGLHKVEESSKVKQALKKLGINSKDKAKFTKETVIDLTIRDENLKQMYKEGGYPTITLDGNKKEPGSYKNGNITFGKKAFASYRALYLTIGHELIHAYHYTSGLMSYWSNGFKKEYIDKAIYNTERGAYSWIQLYDVPSMKQSWEDQFNKHYGNLK